MDGMTFRRSGACPQLYVLERGASRPGSMTAERQVLVLLPYGASLGPVLDLGRIWTEMPGSRVLFLPETLAEEQHAGFARAAWEYFADRTRLSARLAWFSNPQESNLGLRGQYLAFHPAGGELLTDRATLLDFLGLRLLIGKGCAARLAAGGTGLQIDPASGGGCAVITSSTRLDQVTNGPEIPLSGPNAGQIQFTLAIGRTAGSADLAHLDAGLRIFYPDQPTGLDWGPGGPYFIQSLRFPVFSEEPEDWQRFGAGLSLAACLDPLAPLDGNRSFFSIQSTGDTPQAQALPSCYRTNLGYTVYLWPRPGSRLVFAPKPGASGAPEAPGAYLAPSGDFEISVPRYDPAAGILQPEDNLLCGLSGVEYIRLAASETNLLRFIPGQPALAAGFHPGLPADNTSAPSPLTWPGVTSWAYIYRETAAPEVYYAQPDQATLYHPAGGSVAAGVMLYLEVPAAELPGPAGQQDEPLAFPLLPYAGVQSDAAFGVRLDDYQALELHLISPLRRELITRISQAARAEAAQARRVAAAGPAARIGQDFQAGAITGTTPQGLLATYTQDYATLASLVLARYAADGYLALADLDRASPLRDALQSNQLFLVISNPAALSSSHFPDHRLEIAGWTFELDPAGWAEHNTLLIFKFFDKPLSELVDTPHAWSHAADFNAEPEATRRLLKDFFQASLARADDPDNPKSREDYAFFARLMRDPNWSGILALNVALPPASSLPEQLKALGSGIRPEKFYAHHVGVAATPIRNQDGTLTADLSSLFGLVDYQDDSVPDANPAGYNFQVNSLKVLFASSKVKAFSSEVSVTLDRLFDERTQLLDSANGRNLLALKGSVETHAGETTYSFSFSGDNHFALPGSAVLNEVEMIKAQFGSDPVGADGVINARFSFWGRLNFRKLEKFDLFSFGTEPSQSGGIEPGGSPPAVNDLYLSFSGLQVAMSYDPNKEKRTGEKPNPAFRFDPSGMAFDLSRSQARADSLYAHFPLKLTGLLSSTGEKTPDKYGYLPVKSPLGSGKLSAKTWYGLTFDLELGSLGALAGKAGLVVSLLAVWAPIGDSATGQEAGEGVDNARQPPRDVAVGLRLPAASGGKLEMMIQGVLKITFKSIELVVGSSQGRTSYLLKLKNIALKLLVLSLPPNVSTEIIIFGDPQGTPESKTLGWYAAFARNPTPNPAPAPGGKSNPPPKQT